MKKITINIPDGKTIIDDLKRSVPSLALMQQREAKKLQKLQEDTKEAEIQLEKIRDLTRHYHYVYGGLEKLKALKGLPENVAQKKAESIFIKEIQRLQRITAKQQELLSDKPYSSPVLYESEPHFEKTKNLLLYLKRLQKFTAEKRQFEELVRSSLSPIDEMMIEANGKPASSQRKVKAENAHDSSSYVKVGDKYFATYYLSDLPTVLYPQAIYKLLVSSIPFQISMYVEPENNGRIIKQIRSRLAMLEAQQRDRIEKGKVRNHKLDRSIEEMTTLVEELVGEVQKVMKIALYITIDGNSINEINSYHEQLKNITDSIELLVTKYTFGQKKAFEATLPFNEDSIKMNKSQRSSATAYLSPFITKHLYNPKGIFLGVNARQEGLLFVDPFTVSNDQLRNNNMNILGVSGSGKSVTSKIIATRLFMKGTQILAIDPEGEYLDYARAMGGEIIQFSRNNGVNPFSVYGTGRNDILDHILVLKTFFKFFVRPERYDSTILDGVLVSLYENYPRSKPTFKQFLSKLKGTTMYDDLAVLDKGSLQGVFNSERELQLGNDLVVFDISPLKDTELKAPSMYLLTSLIWQLVDKNRERKKMLFIDEAHNLLVDREVAVFYRKVVKEARKRNLGVVSITQNVEDFLDSEWGNGIITNSETKILLKQSFASLPLMEKIAPMTEDEKMMLGSLPVGEFVMLREQEHIHAYMKVLPFEETFVYTSPKDQEDDNGGN